MLNYAVIEKDRWDHRTERIQDCADSRIVGITDIGRVVEDLTGRGWALAVGSAGRKLRAGERVYIAADDSRPGVIVQKCSS